jgi:lipoprotein NlpD
MFKIFIQIILVCLAPFFLSACAEDTVYAPVEEISTIDKVPKAGVYYVRKNDTLYSIAWRYGLDFRYLAKVNHVNPPYHIEVGQAIYLRDSSQGSSLKRKQKLIEPSIISQGPAPRWEPISAKQKPRIVSPSIKQPREQTQKTPHVKEYEPTAAVSFWQWPVMGPVVGSFGRLNKGINIGGCLHTPVYASAPGVVVYSGDGLHAYGNLIIIKHNSVFLSAYAHNDRALVSEGDRVKAGQKIAEMGSTGAPRVMLHFEIRRSGKPVNPLSYLAKR